MARTRATGKAWRIGALLGLFLAWGVVSWRVEQVRVRSGQQQLLRAAQARLRLEAADMTRDIDASLSQLHALPELLAADPQVAALAQRSERAGARRRDWSADAAAQGLSLRFAQAAQTLGLESVLLLDSAGHCIASGGAGGPGSYVGLQYADRDYFRAAHAGRRGVQYAVGHASHTPGLFFSTPVRNGRAVVGVLMLKVPIGRLDGWVDRADAFLTDRHGVVVLAADPALQFQALPGADVWRMSAPQRQALYGRGELGELDLRAGADPELPQLRAFGARREPVLLSQVGLPADGIAVNLLERLPAYASLEAGRLNAFGDLLLQGWMALLLLIGGVSLLGERRNMERSLSLLNATLESTTDAIMVMLPDGDVSKFNQRFVELWGVDAGMRAQHAGPVWLDFLSAQLDAPQALLALLREMEAAPLLTARTRLRLRDQRVFEAEVHPQVLQGSVIGRVWNMRDVTARLRSDEELRIAAIAFESHEGMMVTDAERIILRVNRAFEVMTGYSRAELIGRSPAVFKSGRHDAAFYRAIWERIASHGSWQGEIWNRRKDGGIYIENLLITAVKSESGAVTHYVGAVTDISARKAAEDQVRALAFFDPLTQLPNRRLLLDRIGQAVAGGERSRQHGALMFIDLDRFKVLNDTLGHDVGDDLLVQVAERLRAGLRVSDTVARLGGDEFVVMLQNLDPAERDAAAQAEEIAVNLLADLARPYMLRQGERIHEFNCSASVGICLFLGQQNPLDELFKRADLAMYQAKAAGRGVHRFFDPRMQRELQQRAALEVDLRLALGRGEFVLFEQVQVDRGGRVIGVEALLRWQHPRRGLVLPGEFIDIAEESGLIIPIGQWVIEAACARLRDWAARPTHAHLQIAVNVSPRQFRQADFAAQVRDALQRTGVVPRLLTLELTEGLLLESVEQAPARLQELKALGVRIALDDFGTGNTSLAHLTRIPLDQLKIDRSFVAGLEHNSPDAAVCAAIISLARNLAFEVVAEGVETAAQRYFLGVVHKCDVLQGYLFGHPRPPADFVLEVGAD